jgi:hypothetical protein
MGDAEAAGRHAAGGLRPAGPGAPCRAPPGLPAGAVHPLPGGHPGADRPRRGGRATAPAGRPRGAGSTRPQHGARLRPLLRRYTGRRVLRQGALRVSTACGQPDRAGAAPKVALAAALVESAVSLQRLGGPAPDPFHLLLGDLCLARASRLLAESGDQRLQVGFARAVERVSSAASGGPSSAPLRQLLVATIGGQP